MTYEIIRDSGTIHLTMKRFGEDGLQPIRFVALSEAVTAAREMSRDLASLPGKRNRIILRSSGGVDLARFFEGEEVSR